MTTPPDLPAASDADDDDDGICPRCGGCGEVDDDPYGDAEMGEYVVCDHCGGDGERKE